MTYTDAGHYMAKMKRRDGVYEYDENYIQGSLQLVKGSDPFAERIISMSGSAYKAKSVWCKKTVIS